ncbi:phage tail spike protein [Enterococcus casseliflavus]|uniref:phage tail spike protein n=1 Tax=Enterococcus casseliflavus TaxID=37734 RepID=UPI0039A58F82
MKPILYEPAATDFEEDGGIATLSDCRSLIVSEEANGSYLIECTFPITTKNAIYLEDVNYQIKCKPNDLEDYHVFYIYDHYKDMATGLLYVKAKSRTGKLGNRTVKKVVIQNKTGIEAMALLHDGMDLESDIQLFCDITAQGSTTFEVSNPLECIKGIEGSLNQVYGGEIKHEPFKLSLLKRRGKDNVTTIRYRKNLEGLKIELNWDGLVTRIFPYADIQNKEGETERIYGDKVDSQYIGNYDGEVYARYVQFTEEQGATDLKSLNSVAKKYFTSMNRGVDKPKVSADVEIRKLENNKKFAGFRELGLFDTFTVYHERYNIDLELTVNKIEYDALSERVQSITAGDPKFTFFEQQESQFTEVMKKVPTKSYNSVFIDYVTQIISGNDGGNVIWWPKNRPTDLFFVDGETLEDSKQVLRINKSGIGFSSNGWKGPFDTAWTLDGVFVADFIRAGILSGILVQGVALKTLDDKSFQVVVEGGKVSFEKKVVSTGLDDVHGESLGAITSTYGADRNINGFAIWKEPNYIFSINTGDGDGKSVAVFQIPKESTPDAPIYRFNGEATFRNGKATFEDDVAMNGRLDVKELYVNGVKIDQNGGGSGGNGGGWNGQYPPEVTSDRDKRYWQIWAMFIGAGGTQQAAAALLGNAQGESDANPTADEGNGAPGFGYGVWQWTDGTGATSGRVYMINLMTRAGISGDPDTITTQFKLLMWHAPNGQWIATSAYPYTWSQFMNMTDIAVATRAFEENFERPLNDHPERITWANEWYLKFKDLDIPQSSGYIVPIDAPVTVTSEFGWRTHPITGEANYHNGIDLVNNNSNAPIYASADGEVIVAGDANYFDWYGNWVVIKHSDGMYTGYAHLSSVKVSKGSTVTQGQQIGVIGTTGPSTGIHLHFQFFDEMYPSSNDHFFNPRDYIDF